MIRYLVWTYDAGTNTVDWKDGVGGESAAAAENIYYSYWPYSPYASDSSHDTVTPLASEGSYPMEAGLVSDGTVGAHTALKTGGLAISGQNDLYWIKVQLHDKSGDLIPLGQVTMWPPQILTPCATDTNWAQFWVAAPGQATVPMTPQAGVYSYYTASFEATNCGCTNLTKQDWQQQVRNEIYFDTSGAADMNTYNPANGFMYNRTNLQAVYAFYQKLFNENTNLYWAGLGKLAGAPVYAGLSDAQWSISFGFFTNNLTTFQNTLVTMNDSILQDLAWQSTAYAEGGICALEEVAAVSNYDTNVIDIATWRQIDRGVQNGDDNAVQQGNLLLAHREQLTVLQPDYDILNAMGGGITSLISIQAKNPVSTGTNFLIVVPNGNLCAFPDRWNWITNSAGGIWPSWTAASPANRSTWVNISLTNRAINYAQNQPVIQ